MWCSRASLLLVGLAAIASSGCTVSRAISDYIGYRQQICEQERLAHQEEHLAKLDVRAAEVESLRQAREVYRAERLAAQEQFEAEQEAISDAMLACREESIRSDLGLKLEQSLQLGRLQVDEEALREQLEYREKLRETFEKAKSEALEERLERDKEFYMASCQEALTAGDMARAKEYLRKYHSACDACDVVCDCDMPPEEPLEGDDDQEPIMEPLRPVDIPFMVPVNLRVGLAGLNVERSRVVTEPLEEPLEDVPCDAGCDDCYPPPCPPCKLFGDAAGAEPEIVADVVEPTEESPARRTPNAVVPAAASDVSPSRTTVTPRTPTRPSGRVGRARIEPTGSSANNDPDNIRRLIEEIEREVNSAGE